MCTCARHSYAAMWIFSSYLKSLWKYIRVQIMTIFFYWTVLMDTNRCMYGVSVLCQREQIHTKAEQASFGEFHLNLDILAIKANSAYVITNLSNETSHIELSTEKCLIFPLFPSLFAAIQRDMKMRTTALPCYTAVGPSTEYTPMEFLEAYK